MIPESVVQAVLAKADILQIIGEYTRLKRTGSSYKGLCPLHQEKSPSFHVTPSKGLFYCFGCGAGGSVIDFLQGVEGMSFPMAIRSLGERFSVPVPEEGQDRESHARERQQRERGLDGLSRAMQYYSDLLRSDSGRVARTYLAEREIDLKTAAQFNLGYAPDRWDQLAQHLQSVGVSRATCEEAGLVSVRRQAGGGGQRPRLNDRFRHRLMFPVFDSQGRVIAFSGRTLNVEASAKYINSPESAIYIKGQHLYGLNLAKEAIRRSGTALMVEGNVDVVRLHQAGFDATVAPLGTALTREQGRLLARYAQRVVLLFDGDKAGLRAAKRALQPLRAAGLDSAVAVLPEGEDPDSVLRLYGVEGVRELIASAQPLLQWTVESLCDEIMTHPIEHRTQALEPLTEMLRQLSPAMVQRHYLLESARRLGFTPNELLQMTGLRLQSSDKEPHGNQGSDRSKASPANALEFELLQIILQAPEKIAEFVDAQYTNLFTDHRIRELIERLDRVLRAQNSTDIHPCLRMLEPGSPLRDLALKAIAIPSDWSMDLVEDAYRGAVSRLMKAWVERQTNEIAHQIGEALAADDHAALTRLLEHKTRLEQLLPALANERKINWSLFNTDA